MTEWKTYRLGDVISIKSGFAYKGEYLGKGDKYLLGMGCVSFNEKFLPSGARLYSGDVPSRYFVKAGDIVLATRQQSDNLPILGMPAIIPSTYKNTFVGANLYAVQNDSDIDNNYLYWLLKTPEYIQHIKSCQTGTTVRMITKSNIESFEFKCPNRIERNRISNFLWSLENKIENNHRINTNLELQAQALFDKLFFEANKERFPLSNYADINPTRSIKAKSDARYIEMANLPTKGSFPYDWSFKPFSGGAKFRNGDTIMARITPCLENGKTAYIDFLESEEVAFGSTEYIVMSAKDGYCPALFYFLARNKEFVDYAVGHMNGSSGRQRVSGVDIANFSMPHISIEESKEFAKFAMPIMDVIRNNSLENRHLATLRDTLLPKLMNGEIKL